MSVTPRGPTGAAPLPPADMSARDLPIRVVAAGEPLYRVHSSRRDPIFFGPGAGNPPTYRFDSLSGRFGVFYVAPGPDAAMIETLLRQPQRLTVDYSEIQERSLTKLRAGRDLRLVSAMANDLSRLGTTAALSTGPYDPCGAWSDALFDHPAVPDGILFCSRHNPNEPCIALFERADFALVISSTKPLSTMLQEVGVLLDHHGKSLFGVP